MSPSIEAAKKIAQLVDTSISYLLDETEQANLFNLRQNMKSREIKEDVLTKHTLSYALIRNIFFIFAL
jgi:hypothetical protein